MKLCVVIHWTNAKMLGLPRVRDMIHRMILPWLAVHKSIACEHLIGRWSTMNSR